MPTYTYECPLGHHTKIIQHMREARPEHLACEICERKAVRIFLAGKREREFTEYVTLVGDNTPKRVADPAQERELEKRHKVAHVTDSDMKRMRENMRSDYEKRFLTDRQEPMEETVKAVEREMKEWGVEYRKEQDEKLKKEMSFDPEFERELRAGNANG